MVGGQDCLSVWPGNVSAMACETGVFCEVSERATADLAACRSFGDGHKITHGDQTFFLLEFR